RRMTGWKAEIFCIKRARDSASKWIEYEWFDEIFVQLIRPGATDNPFHRAVDRKSGPLSPWERVRARGRGRLNWLRFQTDPSPTPPHPPLSKWERSCAKTQKLSCALARCIPLNP